MRRCYRGVALALGGVLVTGLTSHDSCSYGSLTVYAAEDTLTEEMETAFQEEVRTEENVETEIRSEETAEGPDVTKDISGDMMETLFMNDADGLSEKTEELTGQSAAEEAEQEESGEVLAEPESQESAEASTEPESQEAAAEEASTEPESQEAAEEALTEPESQETAEAEAFAEPESQEAAAEASTEPAAVETVPTAGNSIGLEEQEYQVLLKIVEAEAGGEDCQGRMLVANVVMNRVRSSRFPNTVTEVVYQRCSGKAQFSPVSDGRIDQVSVSQETVEAVARALNGEDASAGALYFRSVYSKSSWFDRALRRVTEHGNHIFYAM